MACVSSPADSQMGRYRSAALESSVNLLPSARNKAILYLDDVMKLLGLIEANDEGINRVRRHISADDKLLPAIDPVIDPRAAALSRLVNGRPLLADDSLKPEFFGRIDEVGWRRFDALG